MPTETESKSLNETQQKVLRILISDTNSKSTMTGAAIAKRVGFLPRSGENKGGIRMVIHSLRVKGFPICASNQGYFYATSGNELSKFIGKLQARVMAQEEALKGLKQSFHNVGKVGAEGSITYTRNLPVRNPDGSMTYKEFKIGADGKPEIPEGTQLI